MLSHCHDNRSQSKRFSLLSALAVFLLCAPKWQTPRRTISLSLGSAIPSRCGAIRCKAVAVFAPTPLRLSPQWHIQACSSASNYRFAICINSSSAFRLPFVFSRHSCVVFWFRSCYIYEYNTYRSIELQPMYRVRGCETNCRKRKFRVYCRATFARSPQTVLRLSTLSVIGES